MQIATELSEIYTTSAGAVYQCDHRHRLLVCFAGEAAVLKVDAFLRLKKAIDCIDLEVMAANPERSCDFEIITVCGCERCYVLTLTELYAFKELLAGAKFNMELNSMLFQYLHLQAA